MPTSLEKVIALEEAKAAFETLFQELEDEQEAEENEKLLTVSEKLKTAIQTLIDAREALRIDQQADESQAWEDDFKNRVENAMQGILMQIDCLEAFVSKFDADNSSQEVLLNCAEIGQMAKAYLSLIEQRSHSAVSSRPNLHVDVAPVSEDDALFQSYLSGIVSSQGMRGGMPMLPALLDFQAELLSSQLLDMLSDMVPPQGPQQMRGNGVLVTLVMVQPSSAGMFRPASQMPIRFATTSGSTVTPVVASDSAANEDDSKEYEMDMGENEEKQDSSQARTQTRKSRRCTIM